jgi:hypothetical protein
MDMLYVIDVPQFSKPNGSMRSFLDTVTATVLMAHCGMIAAYGNSNLMVKALQVAASSAKISDPLAPVGISPQMLLEFWSKKLEEDFIVKNPDAPSSTASVKEHLEQLARMLAVWTLAPLMITQKSWIPSQHLQTTLTMLLVEQQR